MPKRRSIPRTIRIDEPRLIDRNVAIIKPKQAFLDWLRSTPDWDLNLTLEQLRREECTVILTPDFPYSTDTKQYVESLYAMIFEIELEGWFRDQSLWPQDRSLELFRQWFDVELHSMVIDFWRKPLKRESLW